MFSLQVLTPPQRLPLELSDAKQHLRVDHDLDDLAIEELVRAAAEFIETVTSRALISTQYRMTFESFPCDSRVIVLPRMPLQSVDSILYSDEDNVLRPLLPTQWFSVTPQEVPGFITATDTAWPAVYDRPDAVELDFTAGSGDTADSVPALAKHAIRLLIGHWYWNREAVSVGVVSTQMQLAVKSLMRSLWGGNYAGVWNIP